MSWWKTVCRIDIVKYRNDDLMPVGYICAAFGFSLSKKNCKQSEQTE